MAAPAEGMRRDARMIAPGHSRLTQRPVSPQADEQQEKDTTKRLQDDLASLRVGERVILHDRIKYLGRRFIRDGKIDFDDRQDLIDMHGVYHNALGGNGNLDKLMEEVMELPVK